MPAKRRRARSKANTRRRINRRDRRRERRGQDGPLDAPIPGGEWNPTPVDGPVMMPIDRQFDELKGGGAEKAKGLRRKPPVHRY